MVSVKHYELAVIYKRVVAVVIDYCLWFIAAYAFIYAFGEPDSDGAQSVHGFMALVPMVFWFFIFPFAESVNGQTFGKMLLRISVVSTDKKELSSRQAFKRHLCDVCDFMFLGIPAILLFSNNALGQRLGDTWAKTTVIDLQKKTQEVSKI